MNYHMKIKAELEAGELFDDLTGRLFESDSDERKEGVERILEKFEDYFQAGRDPNIAD